MGPETLKINEAATLLWEEWKYRHELFWKSLYLWGFSAVTVSIFPWINPDIIGKIRMNILIFPITSTLIALFAAWHIASEYARILKVTKKYKTLLGNFSPEPVANDVKFVAMLFKWPIGWIVPVAFLCIALPVNIVNIVLLCNQLSTAS